MFGLMIKSHSEPNNWEKKENININICICIKRLTELQGFYLICCVTSIKIDQI